ncbi:chemotaxis protein CheW [Paenibacillus agricola]|uniref:chemotaxis protein CheW n=1 Tax=Paenibacillus agricola TaxID=2716264 RepID=UPI001FB75935|nr:chemotaxis protein CheW [Paenibacillus agricola]
MEGDLVEALQAHQYIVVELGHEKYALKISEIYEIIKLQKITAVPNNKSFLEGVTNLRGKIVPIISLRKRFGLESSKKRKGERIVVVQYKEEMIGVIVDGVSQVTRFTDIQSSEDIVSGFDGYYFSGIGHSEEGLISILDVEHILDGMEVNER